VFRFVLASPCATVIVFTLVWILNNWVLHPFFPSCALPFQKFMFCFQDDSAKNHKRSQRNDCKCGTLQRP